MNGISAFEVYLYALTISGLLDPFTESFCVRYYSTEAFVVGPSVVGVDVMSLLTDYGLLMLCLWLNLINSLLRSRGNCMQAGLS